MCYLAEKLTSYVINNSRYDEAEYNILKYGFQVGIEDHIVEDFILRDIGHVF